MLGNYADQFMMAQKAERVLAITPNGGGRSMPLNDRERAGSAHVMMKAGLQPGPHSQVSSAWMPGMGTEPVPLPPPSTFMPGMNGVTVDTSTLLGFGALAALVWYVGFRKTSA